MKIIIGSIALVIFVRLVMPNASFGNRVVAIVALVVFVIMVVEDMKDAGL